MALPKITTSDVRQLASAQSFERGEGYYASGAVLEPQQQGSTLTARVVGSEYEPYRVTITLGPDGISHARCNCRYDWGGICKHIVATLLTWVQEPDSFRILAPVDDILAERSKEDLIALIKEMIARQPDLARLLDLPLHPDSPVPFDLVPFRKQVGYALSRDDAEWAGRELVQIEAMADRYLEVGNLAHAGALYHLILEETLTRFESWWLEWDEDGDVLGVLSGCAEGLDACLEEIEDPVTRLPWLEVLLQAELQDIRLGGTDFAWPAGDVVLRQATDEEWIWIEARIRQPMRRASSTWAREALVRLLTARLDAAGQEAEANALILENGTPRQRAFLLLDLGRVEEAVEVAHQHFAGLPGLVIDFANALVDAGHGATAAAYMAEQARHGRYDVHYHPWLARRYEEDGDQAAALEWWHRRFEASPGFEIYQELRRLGGELGTWKSLRPTLLEALDPVRQASLLLNIALDEGDIVWALEIASHPEALLTPEALIRVAQAAETDYPRAALEIYRSRAERASAARGRANYQVAAERLLRVRALHSRLGEEAAWSTYIAHLREDHRRLRALREELDIAGL
jgi:uncharacterized Zn finger protein